MFPFSKNGFKVEFWSPKANKSTELLYWWRGCKKLADGTFQREFPNFPGDFWWQKLKVLYTAVEEVKLSINEVIQISAQRKS